MENKEIVKKDTTVDSLIQRAIDKNVPVETMERLLAMRRELKEEQAREAFYHDFALLQKEMPLIKKTRFIPKKNGKGYHYAPFEDIVPQVAPLIEKYNFSYDFNDVENDGKYVTFQMNIYHRQGHVKTHQIKLPISGDYMNSVQVMGSINTYAMRYLFKLGFAILTADEDNDANFEVKESGETKEKPQNVLTVTEMKERLHQYKDDKTLPEAKRKAIKNVLIRNPNDSTIKLLYDDIQKTYEKIFEIGG